MSSSPLIAPELSSCGASSVLMPTSVGRSVSACPWCKARAHACEQQKKARARACAQQNKDRLLLRVNVIAWDPACYYA